MPTPNYITVGAAAAKWGVSRQRVHQWLAQGRIRGAKPLLDSDGETVRAWLIPEKAKRPAAEEPGAFSSE